MDWDLSCNSLLSFWTSPGWRSRAYWTRDWSALVKRSVWWGGVFRRLWSRWTSWGLGTVWRLGDRASKLKRPMFDWSTGSRGIRWGCGESCGSAVWWWGTSPFSSLLGGTLEMWVQLMRRVVEVKGVLRLQRGHRCCGLRGPWLRLDGDLLGRLSEGKGQHAGSIFRRGRRRRGRGGNCGAEGIRGEVLWRVRGYNSYQGHKNTRDLELNQ